MKTLGRWFVLAASLSGVAVSAALAGGDEARFTVKSSLDGKKVLPLRQRWLAFPSLPASKVSRVDFLVDGRRRWVERHAPYVYGQDDNGRNRGYLITTWLSAGPHRFTVRVTDATKHVESHTVIARVVAAPAPPPALAGKWQRISPGGSEELFAGKWELIFDRIGEWHLDPMGSGVVNQFDVRGQVLKIYAPIQMSPLINDRTSIKRDGHQNIGGFDCNPAGPFGSYHWSVTEDSLTLTRIKELCPGRGRILAHTWTRVR